MTLIRRFCTACGQDQLITTTVAVDGKDISHLACGHIGTYMRGFRYPESGSIMSPGTAPPQELSAHDEWLCGCTAWVPLLIDFCPECCHSKERYATTRNSKDADRADAKGDTMAKTKDTWDSEMHEQVCIACETPFRTVASTDVGKFCLDCREDFGVVTPTDAAIVIDLIDHIPVSVRDVEIEKLKAGRRQSGHAYGRASRGRQALPPLAPPPPPPPIDPKKVAAAVRAMTAYGLQAPLPPGPLPQPTSYVIAKNGLFEVRSTDVAQVIIPATNVIGLTDDLKAGVTLNVPKVPWEMLRQTIAFFRGVIKDRAGAEAIVRIWWRLSTATAAGAYELRIPEGDQAVSGASVRHEDDFDRGGERDASGRSLWLHVMDIHSHNTMSAFWSGTDDADERRTPEGRMFGVIGKLTSVLPEWKWRLRTREGFIDLKVADIFDVPAGGDKIDFHVTWDVILSVLGQTDAMDDKGRLRLFCPVDPFKDATFPQEWMERVKAPSYGGHNAYSGSGGYGWGRGGHGGAHGHVVDPPRIVPQLIYVRSDDGKFLEELEVLTGGAQKATGKRITLLPGGRN